MKLSNYTEDALVSFFENIKLFSYVFSNCPGYLSRRSQFCTTGSDAVYDYYGSKTCKPQIEAGSSGMICHCDVDKRWDWYGRVLWSSTLMRPLHSDFSVSRFVTQGAST